jgi:hypothetical protein
MKLKYFVFLFTVLTFSSCSNDLLNQTTGETTVTPVVTVTLTETETKIKFHETKPSDVTTDILSLITNTTSTTNSTETEAIIESTIDNYYAENYNPLYIDFNEDGVDEIIYRIPSNTINERICIEIEGNEILLPDINTIYCRYDRPNEVNSNESNYGEFTYAFSYYGLLQIDGLVISEWSHGGKGEWFEIQYFQGINDSCISRIRPASDETFYEILGDNDLNKYHTKFDSIYLKYDLNFYGEPVHIGNIEIDEMNTRIKMDELDIPGVEENIKLSNAKNYSVTTFSPDQLYLYKRQRLLNPEYNGEDRQTEEQTEYMLLIKHESDDFKVVDGIFLGTEREDYVARYCRYLYDILEGKYSYNDMSEGSTTEDFNKAWESAGEQSFDDRWELVRELSINENE